MGNFLGVSAAAGAAGAARGRGLPGGQTRSGSYRTSAAAAQRPLRPQDRPDWSQRAQNRNANWQQRVNNRHESWNKWQDNRQQGVNDFQQNRTERWNELATARGGTWAERRDNLWDYRYDRAEEVWHDVRDYHDDLFDDRWWGHHHGGYVVYYQSDPWWWWSSPSWNEVTGYVYADTPPEPVYVDQGATNEAAFNRAATAPQPPPPLPPAAEGQPAEWLPLGVFALVQEEKGDPTLFMQLSVSRDGRISGAYQNTITEDQNPIAGLVDKETQTVSWRIGENRETICTSTLANLTEDVSAVALQFGPDRVENWLLIRLPEPAKEGQPPTVPEIKRTPPPVKPPPAAAA